MPLFINQAMPDVFVIVFMLTLLSAAMSTLSALYHAMGTALVCDLWGRGGMCSLHESAPSRYNHDDGQCSTILAFLLPISIIATGNRDVHGPLCLRLPARIRCRDLCKSTIDKSRSLQHDHRCNRLVPLDRILPCRGSKTSWPLPGYLRETHSASDSPWTVVDPIVIALPISARGHDHLYSGSRISSSHQKLPQSTD